MFFNTRQQWKGLLLSLVLLTQYMHCIGHEIHFHRAQNDELEVCPESLITGEKCPLEKPKEKRLVVAVLFALSIFATLANLAFDIYLQVKGCCGLYPSACTYRDKFDAVKEDIKKRSERMNDEYTVARTWLDYVKQTNQENQNLLQELLRIMTIQKRVIETLDTDILNKLQNKSTDLKIALSRHNDTVQQWSFLEFSTEWNGVFSSVKSAAIGLAPLVGLLGFKAIKSGMQWYKNYKIANAVKAQSSQLLTAGPKASKVLGVSSVKATTAQTISAQQKAASGVSKVSKFAKFAGAAMSVITIGLEIYMAVQKIKACKKVRDNCRDAYNTIKGEPAKMQKTENELNDFKADIRVTYQNVTSQVTTEQFLGHVVKMKQLAQGADVQTNELKQAATYMQDFHDKIKTANRNVFLTLQKNLYKGMTNVEFTWLCFDKKISAVSYVYDHCKKGTNSFDFLYKHAASFYAVNSTDCKSSVGHEYVTYSETEKFIAGRMKTEGYLKDCVLNNEDLKYLVCQDYANDHSNDDIGKKRQLTPSQVSYIIGICPPADVTPLTKSIICSFKPTKNLQEVKKEFPKYDQTQVQSTYNACPTPAMTDAIKKLICKIKFTNKPENDAVTKFHQYGHTVVRNVYRACVLAMDAADKAAVCLSKSYSIPVEALIEEYSKYPESLVRSVYQKC